MIFRMAILFLSLLLVFSCLAFVFQEKPKRFIGEYELEDLLDHDKQYADIAFIYVPDEEALEVFQSVKQSVTIKLFYRTDCVDSIREVPRFIKTIQLANNPIIKCHVVGVNTAKDEPRDLIEGWNLERVPTFIVLHNDEEIGRVIETPEDKIETDLARMLKPFTE